MYDFIIVGVTFPGLLLGAMVARQGKSVLLLDRQHVAGGSISPWRREGYLSLQGIPRIRYGKKGPFADICERIGLSLHLEPLNQAWVLDTDGKLKRITVGKPGLLMGDFLAPLDRFSAVRVKRMCRAEKLEELEEVSLEAWFVKNKIRPSLQRYFQVLAYESTHCTDTGRISAGETLRCFRKAFEKKSYMAYPKKGWMDVLEKLEEKVKGKAEIRWGSKVDRIVVENGKVKGVRVNGESIQADSVVSAVPCRKMIQLLARDTTTEEFIKLCKGAEPSAALIVDIALKYRIFKKKGLWFFLDPPCYGTFLSNLSHMHAPAGKQLATFVCPCSRQEARQPGFIQALEKKIEENLRLALPQQKMAVEWIRSHVVHDLDSVAIRSDQTRTERPGYRVPRLDNLFLVGDSTCAPGACWEMEFESVLACFDRITHTEN